MIISIIAAVSKNGVIGKNNDLPWHLPDDMRYFMNTTKGHHVVMGRKNYESLPEKFRPLPNRTNIVITRQMNYSAPGCIIVHTVNEAIAIAKEASERELFLIGGAQIYNEGLKLADKIYLTEIDANVDGDVFFSKPDLNKWKETSRIHHIADERHAFSFDFVIYKK